MAISKVAAANWALEELPRQWRALIGSALRVYRMEDEEADLERIRDGIHSFYRYAARRIADADREDRAG